MKPDLSLKLAQTRRTWIPYLVLVVTLLLTVLATSYVAISAQAKDRLRFDNAVSGIHNDIQNHLETYITLLRGGRGLFAANDRVSPEQFRAYVDRLELRHLYPGIQGIGFSARVQPEEKDALVVKILRLAVKKYA